MKKPEMLYELMIRKGYPEDFSRLICHELNTEYTAGRMAGYIARAGKQPLEDVADEMLAILNERDRIVEKHLSEHAQAKINEMYRREDEL